MKTNLFFLAALLFAGTAMSQSVSSNSEASSRASASTEKQAAASSAVSSQTTANVNAGATSKAEAAARTSSAIKEKAEATSEAAKTELKEDYQKVKQQVKSERQASAQVDAGSTAKVEAGHNKAGANSSINTGAQLSTKNSLESGANTLKTTEVAITKTSNQARAGAKSKSNAALKAANATMNPGVKTSISSRSTVTIR